ncbi:MAG: hypothetical protein V6Z81_06470 [Parvularculales bacterium]
MSGLFGRQTSPPEGFADAPNPNPGAAPPHQQQQHGGDEGHFTQQTGMPEQRGVPDFEGAESGNVTQATPVNQQQTQVPPQTQQVPPNQQPPPQTQQTQQVPPNQQPPAMDAVALEVKQAALDAREAKLIAQEAQLATNSQNTPEEEPAPSLLSDINEEGLESEGERMLFGVTKQLESELREARKTAEAAVKTADDMRADRIIQTAIAEYGVTREELDQAYQQTGNPDVNLLAQSILYQKSQAAQSQQQTQQGLQTQHEAHQQRVQSVQHITAAPGAQGATRTHNPPAGRGVTNPFDGVQVARAYKAFAA